MQLEIEYSEIDREETALGALTLRSYRATSGETGYEILLDGSFLMATHGSHSERAMASLAHQQLISEQDDLQVLVGGLGAGHTLRAVLDLPGVTRVVVAEVGAKVVEWNRRYFAQCNGAAVDDPRVTVKIADIARLLKTTDERFDLILVDVDNGPGWLASPANADLYAPTGLRTCRDTLQPGGVLAVWSPQANPSFQTSLHEVFTEVEAVATTTIARQEGEPASVIYLASGETVNCGELPT